MTYHLGVDLGTTYTAAATYQDGRAEIAQLGERGPTAASVVGLRDDGGVLAGDAANRQALTDPQRVVREFKRRLGDTTPVVVGGTPIAPEQLSAHLLRWVCDTVSAAKGGPPASVALTHPANWGPFKRDLLTQAAQATGLQGVALVTEPQAAAIHYASQERVEPGSVIAVYDLGGGTFDVAILRKEPDGTFTILGSPEGIERLGGVDVDEAVFARIQSHLEDEFQSLDPDDPGAVAAIARLRQECTQAKEALSLDNEVTIPVLLPNVHTEVRLTRVELEDMIRPMLGETLTALERALRSASMSADQVSRVLLVGGSSRIPLVGEMISAKVGRPVGIDTHPKHAVALGAALAAARAAGVPIAEPAAGPGPGAAPAAVGAAAGAAMAASAGSPDSRPAPPPEASAAQPPTGPPPGQAPPPPGPPPPGAAPPPGAPPPASVPSGSGDPTFDAARSEPPAPSLGYPPAAMPPSPGTAMPPPPGSANMPPPPGAATELPPGYASEEQKARTRRKARRKSRLGLLVILIVLVVALGATFVLKAISEKKLTLADLEVGECFIGEPDDLDVVECSENHIGEMVAIIDTRDEFETHPGEGRQERVHNTMSEKCATKMEEYFGGTMEDVLNVGATVRTYEPFPDDYENENFETYCVGGAVEEGQSLGESFEGKGAESGGGSGGGSGDGGGDSGGGGEGGG